MNLDNPNDRLQLIDDLVDYVTPIIGSITNNTDNDLNDVNDWCELHRLREKLFPIRTLIIFEDRLHWALNKMNDMKQSDEDSKWTFPLEKELNVFVKEDFLGDIDTLVDCSRSWPLKDYRARNFQNELCQKMEMLRDWYKEEYELND